MPVWTPPIQNIPSSAVISRFVGVLSFDCVQVLKKRAACERKKKRREARSINVEGKQHKYKYEYSYEFLNPQARIGPGGPAWPQDCAACGGGARDPSRAQEAQAHTKLEEGTRLLFDHGPIAHISPLNLHSASRHA